MSRGDLKREKELVGNVRSAIDALETYYREIHLGAGEHTVRKMGRYLDFLPTLRG